MWSQCSPLPPVLLLRHRSAARESNWAIAALRNFQKPFKSAKNVLAVRLKNNLQALRDVSWVKLGSGLSLSMFRAYIQIFHNIQTNAFFLRWFTFVVLTAVICVNEVIVTFSSAHSISKHSCVLLFSARISLKTLQKAWHCVEEFNHFAILGLFYETMTCKPAFHAHSAILDSFFYACSAIVDSFERVYLFLEKHYIPQYYRWPTSKVCACLFEWMLWSRWLLFWVG